jgi:hypothetical protein
LWFYGWDESFRHFFQPPFFFSFCHTPLPNVPTHPSYLPSPLYLSIYICHPTNHPFSPRSFRAHFHHQHLRELENMGLGLSGEFELGLRECVLCGSFIKAWKPRKGSCRLRTRAGAWGGEKRTQRCKSRRRKALSQVERR